MCTNLITRSAEEICSDVYKSNHRRNLYRRAEREKQQCKIRTTRQKSVCFAEGIQKFLFTCIYPKEETTSREQANAAKNATHSLKQWTLLSPMCTNLIMVYKSNHGYPTLKRREGEPTRQNHKYFCRLFKIAYRYHD